MPKFRAEVSDMRSGRERPWEVAWFAIGASLPGSSVSAERAARIILDACARSRPYVTIGVIAKAMRVLHAVAPATVNRFASLVNRLLPAPGGAGPGEFAEPGWLHRPAAGSGPWTKLGDEAARRNREVPWAPPR